MAISLKDSIKAIESQTKNETPVSTVLYTDEGISAYETNESKPVFLAENDNLPYSDKYTRYTEYYDSNFSIIDENKNITLDQSQINLTQEENSQYVPFKMFRRYDNVDQLNMTLLMHCVTPIGGDVYVTPVNVQYDDTYLYFGVILPASVCATKGNATVDLVDSGSKKQSVTIKGSGATSVTTDANGVIVVNSTDTKYSHPTSGVSAGTYTKVNVNAQGHVTGGSNPTTLGGYGITDAAAKHHTHGNADITAIDAGKITTGTIDIARLPQGALERLTIVADDTARFKLTKDKVQLGDTVKVTGTGLMYYVVDESKLSSGEGYEVYTAGSATSVPWSGVTGKPSSYTPSAHNQAISTITGLQAALDGKATSAQGAKADTAVQSVKIGTTEYKSGTTVTLPAYPTTLPASDVPAWAKATNKPTYTKSEVGLGNVDNTADKNKSVKYATSAGSATSATNATTASKLGTNAGSTVHPVYFANGVPVACNVSTDFICQGANDFVLDGGGA